MLIRTVFTHSLERGEKVDHRASFECETIEEKSHNVSQITVSCAVARHTYNFLQFSSFLQDNRGTDVSKCRFKLAPIMDHTPKLSHLE